MQEGLQCPLGEAGRLGRPSEGRYQMVRFKSPSSVGWGFGRDPKLTDV